MKIVSVTTRFNLGLICLTISVWLLAFTFGMLPDREGAVVDGRVALAENVALHCSLLASRNDSQTMETSLKGMVGRNRTVRSAAIRRPDGSLLVSVGSHTRHWRLPAKSPSTKSQMRVPILAGEQEWVWSRTHSLQSR